jgi:hypothetical protein
MPWVDLFTLSVWLAGTEWILLPNPALMDVKKQLALHLGAAVVSVGFCGLLQGLTMVVAMAVSMDQPLPVSLFSSLSGVIYMAQLMLLGSIVAHLLPLYPAPGYRIVLRFLSPGIRVKLTHYESLMALVLVLLALFASGILHQYSNLLLTKMNGLTGLILSIAYLPVYGLWLFSMRR